MKRASFFYSRPAGKIRYLIIIFLACVLFNPKSASGGVGIVQPKPFQATLTIQSTGCDNEVESPPEIELVFGFTKQDTPNIIPLPPPLPRSSDFSSLPATTPYFEAFFDPYSTSVQDDGLKEFGGWQQAVLPIPAPKESNKGDTETAVWGVKIICSGLSGLSSGSSASLKLSWDSERLSDGLFELSREDAASDGDDAGDGADEKLRVYMKEQEEVEIDIDQEEIFLKIKYFHISRVENSVLGIICIGGKAGEYNIVEYDKQSMGSPYIGLSSTFWYLGNIVYTALQTKLKLIYEQDDINYVTYRESKLIIDKETINISPSPPFSPQKDRLKQAIMDWTVYKWRIKRPQKASLILYVVGHGAGDAGGLLIDPIFTDKNKLTVNELDSWLDDLEQKLSLLGVVNYEIITFIEACKSGIFKEKLSGSHRVVITSASADQNEYLGGSGDTSFSNYFWNYSDFMPSLQFSVFEQLFKHAKDKLSKEESYQTPQYSFGTDTGRLLVDQIIRVPATDNFLIPFISDCYIEPNNNEKKFIVKANVPIHKVWAVITPLDSTCNQYTTDPNQSDCYCDGNQCTFSPEYNFNLPGIHEVYIFAKDKNNIVSIPYFFYIKSNTPDYEPNNMINQATVFLNENQIHSFTDPDDLDYIQFPAFEKAKYDIRLRPLCSLSLDPNISPFKVEILTNSEWIELSFSKIEAAWEQNRHEYIYVWNNPGEYPFWPSLRIAPRDQTLAFPYEISINNTEAMEYIILIITLDKRKEYIMKNLCITGDQICNSDNKIIPNFCPLTNEYNSKACGYIKLLRHSANNFYDIYLGNERICSVDPSPNMVNIDECLIGLECPTDKNVTFYPGLNLFRYPLWGGEDKNGQSGVKLFHILDDLPPLVVDSELSNMKDDVRMFQRNEWVNFPISSDPFLPNKSGCLIYLGNRQSFEINIKIRQDQDIWENSFDELLDQIKSGSIDESQVKVTINPGLNIIALIAYQTSNNDLRLVDADKFYPDLFDSFSCLHSFIRSFPSQAQPFSSSMLTYDHKRGKWRQSYSFFKHKQFSGDRFPIKSDEAYLLYSDQNQGEYSWLPARH